MKIETERKYLVAHDGWRDAIEDERQLRDGLLAVFDSGKVRIRTDGARGWITVKGPRNGLSRAEFDFEIPVGEAEEMLSQLCGMTLQKTRFLVRHDLHVWEVDVHHGPLAGLVLAEIELSSQDEVFTRPDWLGTEVTGDPAYSKRELVVRALAGKSII
jgi:CYTH domain-containing protein